MEEEVQAQDQVEGGELESQVETQVNEPEQSESAIEYNGRRYTAREIEELERGTLRQDDYTRKTQALAQERAEIEQARAEIERLKAARSTQTNPDPDKQYLLDRDKRLLREQYGVVTQEVLEEKIKEVQEGYKKEIQAREQQQLQEKADAELSKAIKNLEKKYDGIDGKPKFDFETTRGFLLENGIGGKSVQAFEKDLENAYFLMNRDRLYKSSPAKKMSGAPTLPAGAVKESVKGEEIGSLREASKAASQYFKQAGFQ